MSKDTCEIYTFDAEKVAEIKLENEKQNLQPILTIYKALAEQNRLKICLSLLQEEELCVCDLSQIIDATVATTSHHVRYLHQARILSFRKEGKNAFYRLNDNHIRTLIETALAHGDEVNES